MFLAGGYSVFGDGEDNFEWRFVMLYPTAFEQFHQEALGCITNLKKVGTEESVLLHVVHAAESAQFHGGYHKKIADSLRHLLQDNMERAAQIVESVGMRPTLRIELGEPHQKIMKVAEGKDVSLIMLSSRGKSAVKEALMGSISESIARDHIRPVMIIPRN